MPVVGVNRDELFKRLGREYSAPPSPLLPSAPSSSLIGHLLGDLACESTCDRS